MVRSNADRVTASSARLAWAVEADEDRRPFMSTDCPFEPIEASCKASHGRFAWAMGQSF